MSKMPPGFPAPMQISPHAPMTNGLYRCIPRSMSASGRPSLSFADDQREGMRLEAKRALWPTPLSNSHLGNQQSRRLPHRCSSKPRGRVHHRQRPAHGRRRDRRPARGPLEPGRVSDNGPTPMDSTHLGTPGPKGSRIALGCMSFGPLVTPTWTRAVGSGICQPASPRPASAARTKRSGAARKLRVSRTASRSS
jgi:hypothetical protein